MSVPRPAAARLLLLAFALSGGAALVYEVTWTRALSLVIGSTTHAVSTMLGTFMAGLAIGGAIGGRVADRTRNPVAAFALCEIGVGLTGIVSVPLIYRLPALYLALYRLLHLHPTAFFAVQMLLCASVMLVPTILMGATFPLVSKAVTRRMEDVGTDVGAAYSVNTVGAVLGSLAAGFLLVPWLGLRLTALAAGSVNLAVGAAMLLASRGADRRLLAAPVVLAGALALALGPEPERGLFNFYSAHRCLDDRPYERVLADSRALLEPLSEGTYPEGEVRAFRASDGHLILQVGGKIEGTSSRDRTNTLLLAYLPAAAHRAPRRMLVIGLGAGVTLAAAKEAAPAVDLVEIHPGVIEAARRFGPPGVLDGVRLFRDDARSLLLRTDERYDVISSEPSYPTETVVGNLFTREFFALAASRLAEGGVLAQWLPYHLLTNQDVTTAVKTFGEVFPHATLWKIPGGLDLILLGSKSPFARDEAAIRAEVARLDGGRWPLEFVLSRSAEEVARIVAESDVPLNTDDRPILEFKVARNLVIGDLGLIERGEDGPRR